MMRKPSRLISCSHWLPEGSLSVLVGRHGTMNPAGRVRCNMWTIHIPFPLPPRAPAALPQMRTDADGDDVPVPCGFLEVSRRISKRLASKVDRHGSVSQ